MSFAFAIHKYLRKTILYRDQEVETPDFTKYKFWAIYYCHYGFVEEDHFTLKLIDFYHSIKKDNP